MAKCNQLTSLLFKVLNTEDQRISCFICFQLFVSAALLYNMLICWMLNLSVVVCVDCKQFVVCKQVRD